MKSIVLRLFRFVIGCKKNYRGGCISCVLTAHRVDVPDAVPSVDDLWPP